MNLVKDLKGNDPHEVVSLAKGAQRNAPAYRVVAT